MPEFTLQLWVLILVPVLTLLAGGAAGFFGGMFYFRKQQQKNPPITENMIRAMFAQMGRKASESQIRAVMNSMNQAAPKKTGKPKK